MVSAQTEGDTGYDYNDAYDDQYDDESGQTCNLYTEPTASTTSASIQGGP